MYGWYVCWSMYDTPLNIFYYNMNRKCVVVRERCTLVTGGKSVEIWSVVLVTTTITIQRIQGLRMYGNIWIRSVE